VSVGTSGGSDDGVVNHSSSTPTRSFVSFGKERSPVHQGALSIVMDLVGAGIVYGFTNRTAIHPVH
jgi:hypothetical protein